MRRILLTITLTFFVTIALGLLMLWWQTDIFDKPDSKYIKLPDGEAMIAEQGTMVHVRSAGNEITLVWRSDVFFFNVIKDGEALPVVGISGGLEDSRHAVFSHRTADGRWESVQQDGWRGIPRDGILFPEPEKGLPAQMLTFEVIRTLELVEDSE